MLRPSPDRSLPRVGYVLKKYPRLSETFILDEALALEAAGVDVSIFSLRLPDDGRFHAELARVRAPVEYLPEFGSASTLASFRALEALDGRARGGLGRALAFLDRLPPDRRAGLLVQALHLAERATRQGIEHLHAHFMTVAAHAAYLAHLLTGIPFSATAHAKDLYRESVDAAVFAEVARAASAVVTVCEANRRHIEERLVADARVEVIYNGVPLDRLPADRPPRDRRLVLGVGRLVPKKGYGVLLEACRLLADRGVAFRCVLVGDGEERPRLEAQRDRLGLRGSVELRGAASREEVLGCMTRAAVLAAPCVTGDDGNRDALPTVLLEALALGLPVVSTPVGGIPEIVDDGVHGLVVPEGDPVALAAMLERALGDDRLWARMAEAGPRRAAERFDRARTLDRLVELFAGSARRPELAVAR
ncbi:MAG TPA: glycosyltransferase family 4 protein [Actinomycetota bacterium]|nr:glycosyltransferase family 4 protein [Actinomycetota bacterium]